MNERIKELVEQAGLEMCGCGCDMPTRQSAKFAELIVQDCIDIISPYTVRMNRPGEEYLHPILEIKQHFGVEDEIEYCPTCGEEWSGTSCGANECGWIEGNEE